jgi:ATP-dependent Clp protease ATP-binding subunit ClpB
LHKRLAEKDYDLEVGDEALELIAQVGFDPVYGARPLKRAIQQNVENPLAKSILSGQFLPGKPIVLGVKDGNIIANQ